MLEAKLVKEVDEMSVPELLKSSKENVDKLLIHDNSKSDAPVVQTSVVQISSPPVHQPIETGTSPVMQLPITTVENKVHNTTSTSNLTTVPATSCTTPKVPLTHPRTVTTVTDSISTPVACSSHLTQIRLVHQLNKTPLGGAGLSPIKPCRTRNKLVHQLHKTPLGGARLHPIDLKQISTPVSQNSPWRGWTVPNQAVSLRPSLPGTSLQPHPRWGLMPDFPGPPPDAWIDQLDEYGVTCRPQLTAHHHCSFSAMERSLPKFDLGKLDGSPLDWPSWIGRFWMIASI